VLECRGYRHPPGSDPGRTAVDGGGAGPADGLSRPPYRRGCCPALLALAVKAVIMTGESAPPDKGAEGRLTLTDEQEAALKDLAAGKGEPLALAKVLQPVAHFLETYPPANADTEHAWTVRGLVQISSPDAFTLVESERVSVDQAAQIGHLARDAFVYRYPSEVCEEFQSKYPPAEPGALRVGPLEAAGWGR
jgi:hypothetical protein